MEKKIAKDVSLAEINAVLDSIVRRQEEVQEAEARRQEAEDRRQEAEDRRQEAEAERRREEDRRRQEDERRRSEEAALRSKELDWKIDKMCERVDKLSAELGGVSNNIGYHAEEFFQNALAQTLTFGGEKYDGVISNLTYKHKNENAEFDIVLVNGKSVAIIEAKNRIHQKSVQKLASEKIAQFRKYFTVYKNHKVYLGMAGFSISSKAIEEAIKYGIGIIRQDGQSVDVKADHLKVY